MPRPLPARLLPSRLLVVLEAADCRPALLRALQAGGARWFWLRAKDLPAEGRRAAVAAFREALPFEEVVLSLGIRTSATSIVTLGFVPRGPGHAGAIRSMDARDEPKHDGMCGVHLPRDVDPAAARAALGPDVRLGASAHDAAELARAAAAGADYATLSPLFPTASKPGATALGLEVFARLVAGAALPVLALGGIGPARVAAALDAGAAGVAVQGAVTRASDPAAAVAAMRQALEAARSGWGE